jgi:RNA polymerase sigma factor (sigma-70 family)
MKTRSFDSLTPGEADMSAYPDEQLVLEALDDSHLAFKQLVEQYQYRVLRTIASIISDEQAAQDVAQETFLAAWRDLPKLKAEHKFGGWLNQIAINLSKRWLRDERKYQEDTDPLEEDVVLPTQELRYQSEKLRQEIWDAIDELAEDYRQAVILYYISGYSYKEMSEMLSVPVTTVRGRLQQARNQLRKEFMDMVTKLQLEIDSTVHKFLKEHAKQNGLSIEGLIIRLIERYRRDADATEVITRRVWENALADNMSAPSPDGRYLSYVNWEKGNLAIHDFETGKNKDITDEGTWEKESQFADASVWSPDSRQIAYLWFKGREASIRIIGINGSKPRVLHSNPPGLEGLCPRAWSRDGKHILALDWREESETYDIVLVSVVDGSIRVLKSLEKLRASWHWMSPSPDGRYVVYDYPKSENSPNHDIFLLSTDGSHETTLVKHPANNFAPFWAPDGSRIVFASDRSGSMGIWVLEVVDGKAKGSPQLIKHNLNGMFPLGLTHYGSYYYGFGSVHSDIYMATLDLETGKVVTPPAKAIQSFEGFNYAPALSPDGKRIAYASLRPRGGNSNFRALAIHSLETGEDRELSPEHIRTGHIPRWSPDGRSILVFARGTDAAMENRQGLYLIDTEIDAATPVVLNDEQGRINGNIPPVWSPDGNRIFFVRNRDDTMIIRAYDFETEREWSPDFHPEHGRDCVKYALALSPDGQHLAFVGRVEEYGRSFQIVPSAGGETREVLRLPKAESPAYPDRKLWLAWTLDGRHLLFPRLEDEAVGLWRIPAEGGEPQNLGLKMKKIESLSVHPDGRRIVFTGPGSGRGTEVWAMENFLPGFTADR